MGFEFVDAATIDPAARRRIRQKAAKGHNAGRLVVRASRKQAYTDKPGILLEKNGLKTVSRHRKDYQTWDDTTVMAIERPIADHLGCIRVPSYFAPGRGVTQIVIEFFANPLYTAKLGAIQTAGILAPSMWIDLMFHDEAYFHSAMAAGLIALNNACTRPVNRTDAERHFGMVLQLVSRKLSSSDAISDATLCTVVMVLQYERYRSRYKDGIVHFDGLQQMVSMRGGIGPLAVQNYLLVHKLLRADLEYAMHLGSPTRFSTEEVFPVLGPSSLLLSETKFAETVETNILSSLPEWVVTDLSPALQSVFIDMCLVTQQFNDAAEGRRPKLDSYASHHTFLSLGHRLLAFSPLGGQRPIEVLDDMIHVGLASCMSMLMLGLDGRSAELPLLSGLTRAVIKRQGAHPGNTTLDRILLWVLLLGEAVFVVKSEDDTVCLAQEARRLKSSLGLTTWQSVLESVTVLPWVHSLHDAPAHAFWEQMT